MKPVLRRVWAPKGQRPRAAGHHRCRWLYLYAFVEPHRGEVVWFLFNTVNVQAFEAALASFARTVGAGEARIVVLVLDNAGWHVPPDLAVPGGCPVACAWSSCRPTRPNSSRPNASGH